jgi:hypothetical protein
MLYEYHYTKAIAISNEKEMNLGKSLFEV